MKFEEVLTLTKSSEALLDNWQGFTLYLVEKLIRKTSLGSNLSSELYDYMSNLHTRYLQVNA